MKSLQHSAVNYCLGIEGRLQILFRLMKHESAASYCKEELNILRATAGTFNLQSLCFYTENGKIPEIKPSEKHFRTGKGC